MTSGRIQKWEGKLLKVDGKLATHEDCCCGLGEDCEFCVIAPLQYSVTLTGIAAPWAEVNGETVICDQSGDTCRWFGQLDSVAHGGIYHYWVFPWANDTYRVMVTYYEGGEPLERIFLADGDVDPEKDCWNGFEEVLANTEPEGGQSTVVRV